MPSELAISARGLGKAYTLSGPARRHPIRDLVRRGSDGPPEHWALQPVDLDIARGEAVAIVGRNGSGKSTFLQLVCGMVEPTCGEVTVTGRVAPLLELGAGFHPEFTGRENVHLSATILGLSRAETQERFDAIAKFADIGEFIDQPVKRYSTGMCARLAFAVAAHVDADILVVDEILAVGDAGFTAKCMRYIRRFRERGTLFLVSHDVSAVLSLCDRAIWLDAGRVRGTGSAKEVCHAYEASLHIRDDVDREFEIGGAPRSDVSAISPTSDPRRDLLDRSAHRNELELFDFDPDAEHFGYGNARIEHVELLDAAGQPSRVLHGGEVVELVVAVRSQGTIEQPIIGFYIKNQLGQALFGDNTYLTYRDRPLRMASDEGVEARFRFQMPYLPAGDFSVAVAVAEGTQADHTQHHWIEAALLFKVHSTHVGHGLVGIPMLAIEMKK